MRERIAGDTWTDVSRSFQSGSVMVRVASGEKLGSISGDDAPMTPRVFDSSSRARVDVSSGTTVGAVNGARELDESQAAQIDRDGNVYRIELDAASARRPCIWRSAASRGTPSVA